MSKLSLPRSHLTLQTARPDGGSLGRRRKAPPWGTGAISGGASHLGPFPVFGVAELVSWAESGAGRNQLQGGQLPQLLAQLRRTGEDQGFDLIRSLTSGFDGAGSGHAKRPDRLDRPLRSFGKTSAIPSLAYARSKSSPSSVRDMSEPLS